MRASLKPILLRGQRVGAITEKVVRNMLRDLTTTSVQLPVVLSEAKWSMWSSFTAGTGSITGVDATCDMAAPVAADRAFKTMANVVVKAGHTYAVSVLITNFSGATITSGISVLGTGLTGSTGVNITGNGRWGIIFTSPTAQTLSYIRMGVGVGGGVGSAQSATFSEMMWEDITENPLNFGDFISMSRVLTSYPNNTLSSGTSGTVVTGTARLYPQNTRIFTQFGLGVGDSFSNDGTDWPTRLQLLRGYTNQAMVFHGHGVAGATLKTEIAANLSADIGSYPYRFVVLQGGVNDINGGDTLSTIQSSLNALIATVRAASAKIVILNVAPWKNAVAWSSAEQTTTDSYNTWLASAYAGQTDIRVVDMYSALGSSADPQAMAAAYDSGDGLHPNTAGSDVIASLVNTALRPFELI